MRKLRLLFYGAILVFGIIISIFALKLGYGQGGDPGPGFMAFWCGVIISFFSSILMLTAILGKREPTIDKESPFEQVDLLKPIVILVAMVFYGLLLPQLGFIIDNFLFLILILKLVWNKNWIFILKASFLINVAFYLVFSFSLKMPIPHGFLESILH